MSVRVRLYSSVKNEPIKYEVELAQMPIAGELVLVDGDRAFEVQQVVHVASKTFERSYSAVLIGIPIDEIDGLDLACVEQLVL